MWESFCLWFFMNFEVLNIQFLTNISSEMPIFAFLAFSWKCCKNLYFFMFLHGLEVHFGSKMVSKWGIWRPRWAKLGHVEAKLEQIEAKLKLSWATWAILGRTWTSFGRIWAILAPVLMEVGTIWCQRRPKLTPNWSKVDADCHKQTLGADIWKTYKNRWKTLNFIGFCA